MTLVKCCPSCGNHRITAPHGDRVEWYCTGCLKMFDQPVECEMRKERKKKRKPKISPELAMQEQRRIELLLDIQAACKRARGEVRAFELLFTEKKHHWW